jgi:glutathione S-transferase
VAVVAAAAATEDQVHNARERIEAGVRRIEAALADSDWLVGGAYSIADINSFALAHTLPRLLPDLVNETRTPRTKAWLDRIGARPAVKAALATRRKTGEGDCFAPPI